MTRLLVRVLIALAVVAIALGSGAVKHPYRLVGADTAPMIDITSLFHDGHDLNYRSPFGAVPAGSSVTLRLRTAHQGATAVTIYLDEFGVASRTVASTVQVPMQVTSGSGGYDVWQGTVTPTKATFYGYRFLVQNGSAQSWYAYVQAGFGGPGHAVPNANSQGDYPLTSYQPGFATPSWMQSAVMYQIFPDRFFNGDKSNDHKGMSPAWDGIRPTVHKNVNDPATQQVAYGQFDFYGGDLAGISKKLPYLKGLGINVLYLNPIFLAATNHKYDTANYKLIDPRFGTLMTFKTLIKAAHKDKIRVILDGVFNHVGWDSVYFNRFGHFKNVGAYQSKSSPYFSWFDFQNWPSQYSTYFNVESLPQLNESAAVKDFIYRGPNSVAQYWLKQGADGWRLDHSVGKSAAFWQDFRATIKAKFPKAAIICECDLGSPVSGAENLLGDQFDGDMNYNIRAAALSFFARGNQGYLNIPFKASMFLNFSELIDQLYPLPAIYASMNVVGTHDTDRTLDLVHGSIPEMKQIAAFQLTWLGMPEIYYGDEAGLGGSGTDPEKRKFFPWSNQNKDLESFYRTLIHLRAANSALRDGAVSTLVTDDANRIAGYLRTDPHQTVAVVINDDTAAHDVSMPVPAFAAGTTLTDALSGQSYQVGTSPLTLHLGATSTAILIPNK